MPRGVPSRGVVPNPLRIRGSKSASVTPEELAFAFRLAMSTLGKPASRKASAARSIDIKVLDELQHDYSSMALQHQRLPIILFLMLEVQLAKLF
jgi:hypothetical protein